MAPLPSSSLPHDIGPSVGPSQTGAGAAWARQRQGGAGTGQAGPAKRERSRPLAPRLSGSRSMNPPLAARLAGAPVGPNAPSVRVVGSSTPRSADGPDQATAILAAAHLLLPNLEHGQRLNAGVLRAAMTQAFGSSDASGAWDWKLAYEASEAATVLFLRRYGPALIGKARSPEGMLRLLGRLAALLPTQTRRSEESAAFQQFSSPIALGWAVVTAANIQPGDLVLEPRPARASSPSSPSSRAAGWRSTSWPRPGPTCWRGCSRRRRSPDATLRRSTTVSIPQSAPPSSS